MSQYRYTESQRRYLRKHFARIAASVGCCDCPGCDQCDGFVRGCECDMPPSKLTELLNEQKSIDSDEPPF